MAQPATILDVPGGDTVRFGTQLVNFATAGNLIAEDIQFTKGTRSVALPDIVGRDSSAAYSSVKGEGTMTLQLKSVTSTVQYGDLGNLVLSNASTMPFIVIGTSEVYVQNGAAKIQITFTEWLSFSSVPQLTIYDGSFSPRACSPLVYVAHNLPVAAKAIVVRQQWCCLGTQFASGGLNDPGPTIEGTSTWLVNESEPEDQGSGGMVKWWKTWASLPANWTEIVYEPKTYQIARYTYDITPFKIREAAVTSYSLLTRADCVHSYYFDTSNAPGVAKVPQVQAIQFNGIASVSDFSTGFPTIFQDGQTFFDKNVGHYTVMSCSVEAYLGKMIHVRVVSGT